MRLPSLAAAFFALFVSSRADSQVVVQLPTFRVFSVSTTVVVPDRGTAYLGGVSRAAYGSSSAGLPIAGRLPGASRLARATTRAGVASHSGAYVSATIIDHDELDQQLLAEAPAVSPAVSQVERTAAFLAQHVARHNLAKGKAEAGGPTVPITNRPSAATTMSEAEARELIQRGERLEHQGRPAIARIFYRTVAKQAAGAVRHVASQRLSDLDHDLNSPRIAGR